ncbi:Uncharacterized protein FWK35_00025939, partial [Aphis craccivora]
KKKQKKANGTQCSQAVTHPSTNYDRRCLTSVIGRELVYSTWYGRWRPAKCTSFYLNSYLLHNTVYLLFILPKHTSRTHYPLHRLYLNIHSRTILKKNFTYTVQNVINNFVILLL